MVAVCEGSREAAQCPASGSAYNTAIKAALAISRRISPQGSRHHQRTSRRLAAPAAGREDRKRSGKPGPPAIAFPKPRCA